jgi:hypothetical protein
MRVRVQDNKTGDFEIKELSMELHHLTPRHQGGSDDAINLVEVSPFVHEIIDPYRHNGFILDSVINGLATF